MRLDCQRKGKGLGCKRQLLNEDGLNAEGLISYGSNSGQKVINPETEKIIKRPRTRLNNRSSYRVPSGNWISHFPGTKQKTIKKKNENEKANGSENPPQPLISDQKLILVETMNFLLLRSNQQAVPEPPPVQEEVAESTYVSSSATSLEGLIGEDPFPEYPTVENHDAETNGHLGENAGVGSDKKSSVAENHIDVCEEDGWITIPYKCVQKGKCPSSSGVALDKSFLTRLVYELHLPEIWDLPDDWDRAPDISSLRSLDRSFVFPGEQVHVLACLSACNQETEIITPFKVAAVMCKSGKRRGAQKQNGNMEGETNSVPEGGDASLNGAVMDQNGENLEKDKIDPAKDVSASESFLRMEDHRRQTETLLKRFKNSHFFVRIAESGEPLWSKKGASEKASESSEMDSRQSIANETKNAAKNITRQNAVIDRGNFDANVSGGVARDSIKCCSLSSGDIVLTLALVLQLIAEALICDFLIQSTDSHSASLFGRMQVLLRVNVGVDFLRDPVIEILQFEKYQDRNPSSKNQDNLVYANQDPCGELLKWLLPLDNTLPTPLTLSPLPLGSASGIGSPSQRPGVSASSGSPLFSFSHFRSYSMSSLPQNVTPPAGPVKAQSSKPSFDLDDVDHYSSQKNSKGKITGIEELLSYRGVSLERERFSVRCGLEGIHIPGRRWRRKLQIIQPIEIHSYAADCNTDDLLCVQIKNISPENVPDIVVFVDAITVVLEEASKGGPPASLPISCIEAGDDHSLPNLALRLRGEEHSFILKPVFSMWKDLKTHGEKSKPSALQPPSMTSDRKGSVSVVNHYAVMVSFRCNYTESRLFFKQPTSWRPRVSRDLMISVASEMSGQYSGPNEGITQLPVQVLTLQASNLSDEDLTMTVLAPTSLTSPPSVVSLNSSPTTPMSPFVGFSELAWKAGGERRTTAVSMPSLSENQKQNGDAGAKFTSSNAQLTPTADFIPTSGLGCTHLWLQSRVPLGCVPAQSTATIKLELLPLTDGIITLDTLQIYVKEKGLTYIPEHSLMINATSSISTGII
ncbi:Heat-inducible transcription repressor HrcA [Gossypium australe]|uniref:Heat-inducible transcription repressor HrcA n=1 Tax=Gossypium australe TaxID=47621 RepID=A0A5B6X205_9ROSI|nr:Heat-inducible transcription repressor HrcA [Gossypium australe]